MPTAYAGQGRFQHANQDQPSFPAACLHGPLAALPYLILRRLSSPSGSSAVPASTRASQHRQLGVVLAHASHFLSAHPHDAMDGANTVGRHHNLRALCIKHQIPAAVNRKGQRPTCRLLTSILYGHFPGKFDRKLIMTLRLRFDALHRETVRRPWLGRLASRGGDTLVRWWHSFLAGVRWLIRRESLRRGLLVRGWDRARHVTPDNPTLAIRALKDVATLHWCGSGCEQDE